MKKKMFYFVNTEKSIEKYLVKFDEEKIRELKQEIILNCGSQNHCKYTDVVGPMEEKETIKNLKVEVVGKRKYDIGKEECCEDPELDVYSFEYDEYKGVPTLVTSIEGLLEYKEDSLNDILEYESCNEIMIEGLKKNTEELRERQKHADEYLKQAIQKSINGNEELLMEYLANKKVSEYHKKLLELIKLEKHSEMCLSDINIVESFFGIDIIHDDAHVYEINDNFEKVIKK